MSALMAKLPRHASRLAAKEERFDCYPPRQYEGPHHSCGDEKWRLEKTPDLIGGPGRTRTSNQTVMSGPAAPKILSKIGVFRRVHACLFASVHGVPVVRSPRAGRYERCNCGLVAPLRFASNWERTTSEMAMCDNRQKSCSASRECPALCQLVDRRSPKHKSK